jgi:hypothetical protein
MVKVELLTAILFALSTNGAALTLDCSKQLLKEIVTDACSFAMLVRGTLGTVNNRCICMSWMSCVLTRQASLATLSRTGGKAW